MAGLAILANPTPGLELFSLELFSIAGRFIQLVTRTKSVPRQYVRLVGEPSVGAVRAPRRIHLMP